MIKKEAIEQEASNLHSRSKTCRLWDDGCVTNNPPGGLISRITSHVKGATGPQGVRLDLPMISGASGSKYACLDQDEAVALHDLFEMWMANRPKDTTKPKQVEPEQSEPEQADAENTQEEVA